MDRRGLPNTGRPGSGSRTYRGPQTSYGAPVRAAIWHGCRPLRERHRNGYDVAVLGAGPAGSVAATVLARAGVRVALLGFPPQRPQDIRRGETLAPLAASVLARLELTDRIAPCRLP